MLSGRGVGRDMVGFALGAALLGNDEELVAHISDGHRQGWAAEHCSAASVQTVSGRRRWRLLQSLRSFAMTKRGVAEIASVAALSIKILCRYQSFL